MRKISLMTLLALMVSMPQMLAQKHNANTEERIQTKGFAVMDSAGQFQQYEFTRHSLSDDEILIDILYTGICHSDISAAKNHWGVSQYPCLPGHEMVGRVAKVGKNVTKFKVGDYAGVGCMINSCGECIHCLAGEEQFCDNHQTVYTYGSQDMFHGNELTMGGYSDNIVVSEKFALTIPKGADIKRIAPLLCAGITTYSPIKFSHVDKGDNVGVAGFGGLGHLAVQYMVRLGANVTVFDITEDKRADALRMGAVKYVNVNNSAELNGLDYTMDFIVSTIPSSYDPFMYLNMLKKGGELAILGMPGNDVAPMISVSYLGFAGNKKLYGSMIGGIPETQEMLNYSVANNIYPEVEIVNADATSIDRAYQNVIDGKVKFRYVIDMKTMK